MTAYVTEYGLSDILVTAWVGTAESKDAAADLTERMTRAIGNGSSGFSNVRKMAVAGHDVFQVDGPGGKHFFCHSLKTGGRVVWLTIEGADVMPVLEQAVTIF